MKKVSLLVMMFLFGAGAFAQAPEMMNYQCVVRNASGISITDQLVGVRVAILQGSTLGPEVFAETHGPTTNSYGLINIQIGTGSNTGPTLDMINWGSNSYFLKVEIDPTGGTSYSVSSTSQLISTPYALYAKEAGNVNDADSDPTNEYNTGGIVNGDSLEITDGGGTISIDLTSVMSDPDMDPNNEIQTLFKVGNVITLTPSGGAVTDDVNDADADPTNEVNSTLTLVGSTLQLTDAGGTLSADLSTIQDDADADPTNEYNSTLTLVGSTLQLTDGGGTLNADLSSIQNDADADPTNEYNSSVSLVGTNLLVTDGGGTIITDLSALGDDADADPNNEFQTVNQVGTNVTLSDGGGTFSINDNDASATNEFNTGASLTGTDLNITDGGGTIVVDLSPIAGGGGNPTDELNTLFFLDGDSIKITDAGGTLVCDLSPLISGGGDLSTSNELITNAQLVGTDLIITEAGTPWTVDLSSLSGGSSDIKVGQYYQGGIVVYVDSTGIHGLIAGFTDLTASIEFEATPNQAGTAGDVFAPSFTDGAANTTALVSGGGAPYGFSAAALCDSYSFGGYTDWFLPSLYELELMLGQNYVMGDYALNWAGGIYYWSSTEDSAALGFNAYKGRRNLGTWQITSDSELNTAAVRPMRAF